MSEKHLPIGMLIGNLMRPIVKVVRKQFNETEIKLTFEQFGLLHALSIRKEEVVQQDMAEILGKDKSAVLRLIDSLESKGLAVRTSDPHDRRKNVLAVTDEGFQILKDFQTIGYEMNSKFIEGISAEDMEVFYSVVQRIQLNAEKMI